MKAKDLKYVVGTVETGKPAVIRFFDAVRESSACRFRGEFEWLHDYVKPSKITVLINSEGGSVIHGMSVYSLIANSEIPVDTVIEGIAASMGSVIWAAGDNRYMHDYSLLMIHNPFHSSCAGEEDPNIQQQINAFKSQLELIYQHQFGLSKEAVAKIMDGEKGVDGTFFTAKEACKAGFLNKANIIKTSKKVRDKVKNEIKGVGECEKLRDIMSTISAEIDEDELLATIDTIHNRNENSENSPIQVINNMENQETQLFDTIFAQLGLNKDSQTAAISARIAELMKAETTLKDTQAALDKANIDFKGKEAELANVNSELAEVKSALQVYKDAEAAAHETNIQAVIDAAINAGKIEASAKEAWVELAHSNFDHVKATLDSIQARDKITEVIAQEPENQAQVANTLSEVEAKMQAEIKARFGEVTFEKF